MSREELQKHIADLEESLVGATENLRSAQALVDTTKQRISDAKHSLAAVDGMRTYNAGELQQRPGVTREEQEACPANFTKGEVLYLVRCVACTDDPRGRENYLPAAATGICAWCGWGDSEVDNGQST